MKLSTLLSTVSESKYQIIEQTDDDLLYFHKVNYLKDSLDVEKHTTYTEYCCKVQLPDRLFRKDVKDICLWGSELTITLK